MEWGLWAQSWPFHVKRRRRRRRQNKRMFSQRFFLDTFSSLGKCCEGVDWSFEIMDVCFLWACIMRFGRLLAPPPDIRVAYRFICCAAIRGFSHLSLWVGGCYLVHMAFSRDVTRSEIAWTIFFFEFGRHELEREYEWFQRHCHARHVIL